MARPAEYALAHLPQYHALEFGKSGYFLLREPALGLCSLTYFVNEASEHWRPRAAIKPQQGVQQGVQPPPRPNVAYKVVRPREGGVALGLLCLEVLPLLPPYPPLTPALPCHTPVHHATAFTVRHPLSYTPLALPRGTPRPFRLGRRAANPNPSHWLLTLTLPPARALP